MSDAREALKDLRQFIIEGEEGQYDAIRAALDERDRLMEALASSTVLLEKVAYTNRFSISDIKEQVAFNRAYASALLLPAAEPRLRRRCRLRRRGRSRRETYRPAQDARALRTRGRTLTHLIRCRGTP